MTLMTYLLPRRPTMMTYLLPRIMKQSLHIAPLIFLKYLGKLNGLLPFHLRFDGRNLQANSSTKCMSYSVAVFSVLLTVMLWSNYHILLTAIAHPDNRYILNFATYSLSSFKTIIYSILQLTQSYRLIYIINATQRLHERIQEVYKMHPVEPYVPLLKAQQYLTWKLVSVFVQLLLIAFLCVSMPLSYRNQSAPFEVIVTHYYIPVISVLVSCFYCFGLLVMWLFYAKLNALVYRSMGELRTTSESVDTRSFVKMNVCCTLSDELDWLAMLYSDVSRCTKYIVDLFACQVVAQFAYAIICVTVEVGHLFINNNKYLQTFVLYIVLLRLGKFCLFAIIRARRGSLIECI